MAKHLIHEIEKLKKRILGLGAKVEENLNRAVRSIEQQDAALAERVVEYDGEIDRVEVEVEEECLKILALHQPVAIDLRFIVAVLKINSDLERIGDLAANLGGRAALLSQMSRPDIDLDFGGMAYAVQTMLREGLDALVNLDVALARGVCRKDDAVDAMNCAMFEAIKEAMRRQPQSLEAFIHLMSASRQLERIADHATNIAEDVIYMVEGDIVRHRLGERP